MTPFFTYTLLFFMGAYGVLLIAEILFSAETRMLSLLQILGVAAMAIVLHLTTGFPVPVQAFGGADPLWAVLIMLGCVVLGMMAHYGFFKGEVPFSWREFLRPLLISPIVIGPLLGSVVGAESLSPMQLVSFMILGFQNGFFWKQVLDRAKPKA